MSMHTVLPMKTNICYSKEYATLDSVLIYKRLKCRHGYKFSVVVAMATLCYAIVPVVDTIVNVFIIISGHETIEGGIFSLSPSKALPRTAG